METAEDVGEEAGTMESGDAAEAVDGALELALFGGACLAGEKALGGGPGESHHVEEGDADQTRRPVLERPIMA